VRLSQAIAAEARDSLDDISDDELFAAVRAALPRYLAGRLRARSPWILAGVALLSLFVARHDGSPDAAIAAEPGRQATPSLVEPSPTLTPGRPESAARPTSGRTTSTPAAVPTDARAATTSPSTPPSAPGPTGGGGAGDPGCTADAALGPMRDALEQLQAIVPATPAGSAPMLLATVAGCEEHDPAFALLGLLLEIGEGMPDPGPVPPLPAVPSSPLPAPVADLVEPLGPLFAPACGSINQVFSIALLGLETWPHAYRGVIISAALDTLQVCNTVAPPTAPAY